MTTGGHDSGLAQRLADGPAASMELLASVLRGAELDYGQGRHGGRDRPGPLRLVGLVVVLVVVGLVLTVALVQRRHDAPAVGAARQALAKRVSAGTAALALQQQAVDQLQERIAVQEQQALARTAEGATLAARLDGLELALGGRAVSGPGLTLLVQDAQSDPVSGAPPDGGRVLDQDLQIVVNGLWQAGAEAIAVNGERLTATSAIRTAGEAILVDLTPLLPPYRVDAIGDPARLPQQFDHTPAAADLRALSTDYGIRWQVQPQAELHLPAAPGDVG